MRKFIKFADGQLVELSPLTYKEFMAIDLWCNASDTAYAAWLGYNKYVEATDYTEEALRSAHFFITYDNVEIERLLFNAINSQNGEPLWGSYLELISSKEVKSFPLPYYKSIPEELIANHG